METKISTGVVSKFMMITINVGSIPKSKNFYADILGLRITTDYRIDDDNWWVTLAFPEGGPSITLARSGVFPDNVKPETMSLYFETSNVFDAHRELINDVPGVNDIQDDLFGPGSGVKFFNFKDPDGNLIHIVQAHEARAPF